MLLLWYGWCPVLKWIISIRNWNSTIHKILPICTRWESIHDVIIFPLSWYWLTYIYNNNLIIQGLLKTATKSDFPPFSTKSRLFSSSLSSFNFILLMASVDISTNLYGIEDVPPTSVCIRSRYYSKRINSIRWSQLLLFGNWILLKPYPVDTSFCTSSYNGPMSTLV